MDGIGNENPESPKRPNVIEKTPCDPWIILSHQLRFGPWVRPGLTYKENPVINLGFAWKKFQKYSPKNHGLMLISHGYKVNKYIKQIQETGKKQSPFLHPQSPSPKKISRHQPLALWCCDPESPTLTWHFLHGKQWQSSHLSMRISSQLGLIVWLVNWEIIPFQIGLLGSIGKMRQSQNLQGMIFPIRVDMLIWWIFCGF